MSHSFNFSFCLNLGLVSDFLLRKLFLGIGKMDVQFQCRLFRLVQALIFVVLVGFLGPFFVPFLCCLVVLVGFFIVVFHTLVGVSVIMVLLLDDVKLFLMFFWVSFYSESFARRIPTWRLPEGGRIADFIVDRGLVRGGPSALSAALGGASDCLASGSGGDVKRVRLCRKFQHALLDRVFRGSRLGLGFSKGLRIHYVLILVFLVLSF